MPGSICARSEFVVGKPIVVDCSAPYGKYAVVFEDDGETGYFFGLDMKRRGQPILDALHIYDVSNVVDKDKSSVIEIAWSEDCLKSALILNNYFHAVFDFKAKRGYCHTNFPPPDKRWTKYDHKWDDSALELFT